MIAYPAKFEKAVEGGFVVEFIDMPSCVTEGDTLEEAKVMAKEALSAMLYSLDSRKKLFLNLLKQKEEEFIILNLN